MAVQLIRSLFLKDLSLYFRDRFFAFITVLSLVFYALIYFVMPSSVDENFDIGVYVEGASEEIAAFFNREGFDAAFMDSEDELRAAVEDGDYMVGVVVPVDLAQRVSAGEEAALTVYYRSDTSAELKQSFEALFRQIGVALGGSPVNVQIQPEILGENRLGNLTAIRDRMLPLFAVLILITETMGLASLIAEEIERRTVAALLITPMEPWHLFTAKGLMGTSLAFSQAALLMLITGGFSHQPLLIVVTLLLGALLVTGVGFVLAAFSRDLLSVVSWGIMVFFILSLPALGLMFPGTMAGWVEIIPSHYLVDTVNQVANYGAGWGDVTTNLLVLLVSSVVLITGGSLLLKRRLPR